MQEALDGLCRSRFFGKYTPKLLIFGLKQGLAQLAVERVPDDQRPDLFIRLGLDASALVLVQPPSSGFTDVA